MKWLSVVFLVLLPFWSIAQNENPYQSEVGFNFTYNGEDGLGISARYKRQIAGRGIAKLEFNTNGNNTYIGRIGYEPLQIHWDKIELGLGLDLKYEVNDFSEFGQERFSDLALEFPIELRYNISDEYSIYSGLSFSTLLHNGCSVCNINPHPVSEIRLGLGYKF